jgi:N-methylhydantoinase A
MALHLDKAAAAVGALASGLGLDTPRAAAGMVQVANAAMASAARLSLFEKGVDPRDFVLVPFGGAAGLHAIGVAEELDMSRVLFPMDPGTLSARGILFADIAHDLAETRLLTANRGALPLLEDMAERLRTEGDAMLARDGVPADQRRLDLSADMRYRGQGYEMLVPWDGGITMEGLDKAVAAFHALHLERFAHQDLDETPEIVTLRLVARGLLAKADVEAGAANIAAKPKGQRDVDGAPSPIYAREAIADAPLSGPMIIEEAYTTLWLPAGWSIRHISAGNLLAERV